MALLAALGFAEVVKWCISLQRRLRVPRPQGPSARDLLVDRGEEAAVC